MTIALEYEELVPRRAGLYEQTIPIALNTVRETKSIQITVTITNFTNITVLRALQVSSDKTIDEGKFFEYFMVSLKFLMARTEA